MAFEDVMNAMRESVQESLDELTSPRSSFKTKTKALQNLERHLATACCSTTNDSEARDSFLALQHTFELPVHLLSWITLSTQRLEGLTTKTAVEGADVDELAAQFSLSLSLLQGIALNHEPSKRYLGRRRAVEVLLDLLLASRHLASPSDNAESQRSSKSIPNPPHLTSIVLDTLLCILVDSTPALRTFEETNGVQAVVKILKRAGTPREVRMKCLEFLYFYLLDETPTTTSAPSTSSTTPQPSKATQLTPPPTAPTTPIRPAKPYFSGAPMRPSNSSRYGSSTFAFSSSSGGISVSGSSSGSGSTAPFEHNSSRSTSNSSTKSVGSFSSISSNASSSSGTSVSGGSRSGSPSIGGQENIKEKERVVSPVFMESIKVLPKSPVKRMGTPFGAGHGHGHSRSQSQHQHQLQHNATPPNSPPLGSPSSNAPSGVSTGNKFPQLQPRSMMMLRKEVDYVPLSPKKLPSLSGALAEGNSNGRRPSALGHHKSLSMSSTSSSDSPFRASRFGSGATSPPPSEGGHGRRGVGKSASEPLVLERQAEKEDNGDDGKVSRWKTTEEKKELLGTMLGNVDALVEGVRKAGIWGLG
ncbi:hypothetical protein NLJ89_g7825 [Agrocybe chaxingu]|uniref:Cell division control protein 14 n=1 Tax=Agrocybe chaxingu TaxID=84603 RepID=A0A9W8JW19_9AGAR|nr:hypothetical protein NLJ89_g7825 [Agrocybe chaxingu]